MHALNADDGSPLWCFTAGGRVDSPPTVHGGRVYFGSADGWMYCLRAEDGGLAWRFRVAPGVEADRLLWPAGIRLARPRQRAGVRRARTAGPVAYAVGRKIVLRRRRRVPLRRRRRDRRAASSNGGSRTAIRRPASSRKTLIRGVSMPGAMPDVLATDGASIFMRHQRFDFGRRFARAGRRSPVQLRRLPGRHVVAPHVPANRADDGRRLRRLGQRGQQPHLRQGAGEERGPRVRLRQERVHDHRQPPRAAVGIPPLRRGHRARAASPKSTPRRVASRSRA